MKPEHEDPNNHVPEVLPGDDWDDEEIADEAVKSSDVNLPSKQEARVPARRNESSAQSNKGFKGRHVTRYEPKSQADSELEPIESTEPKPKGDSGDQIPAVVIGKTIDKSGKAHSKQSRGEGNLSESVNLPTGKSTEAKRRFKKTPTHSLEVVTSGEEEIVEDVVEKVKLPTTSKKTVRHRVHEINRIEPTPPDIKPVSKISSNISAPQIEQEKHEEVSRQRRQFVAGERGDWGEKQADRSARWMIYTGLGVVFLVILTVILSQKLDKKPVRDSNKSLYSQLEIADETPAAVINNDLDDSKQIDLLNLSQKVGQEIYTKYASANSIADFADFIYDREQVEAVIEKHWQPIGARASWIADDSSRWLVLAEDGRNYATMTGVNDDFSEFVAFFQIEDGVLKLDWKGTAAYSSASYDELKSGKGDTGEIRGYLSKSDFFTFALPESDYRSFRLMSPNRLQTVWVYSKIDSALDQELMKLFSISPITGQMQNETQLTLSLERGPSESLPSQWMIKDLTGLSWLDR